MELALGSEDRLFVDLPAGRDKVRLEVRAEQGVELRLSQTIGLSRHDCRAGYVLLVDADTRSKKRIERQRRLAGCNRLLSA